MRSIDLVIDWLTDATKLTAIATAVIALFTGTLFFATLGQWKQLRREFLSTHRPKIIVHAVEIAVDTSLEKSDEPTIGASVIYFNIGNTPAHLTKISAKITRRRLPLQSGLGFGIGAELAALAVPKGEIVPGRPEIFAVRSTHTLDGERFAQRAAQDPHGKEGALVLIGKISYRDGRGIDRQTGFCRMLDLKSERWVPLEGYPEYEYSY